MVKENGISDQISLLFEETQVVSYKWLSRKLSISSNCAKRALEEFVEQLSGNTVEVVYAISGWTKSEPCCYKVQLVPKPKLEEIKRTITEPYNVHVYSVQRGLVEDPAVLCHAEHAQTNVLSREPLEANNCLRDNRFSAVSCTLVSRNLAGKSRRIAPPPPLNISPVLPQKVPTESTPVAFTAPSKAAKSPETKSKAIDDKPVPNNTAAVVGVQKPEEDAGKDVNRNGQGGSDVPDVQLKKKAGVTGAGGSLASLWSRASSKPKVISSHVHAETKEKPPPTIVAGDAEACVRALESACDSSDGDDDDAADFARIRRGPAANGSGRKRRVIFDDDDDDDDDNELKDKEKEDEDIPVVSLSSPEVPRKKVAIEKKEKAPSSAKKAANETPSMPAVLEKEVSTKQQGKRSSKSSVVRSENGDSLKNETETVNDAGSKKKGASLKNAAKTEDTATPKKIVKTENVAPSKTKANNMKSEGANKKASASKEPVIQVKSPVEVVLCKDASSTENGFAKKRKVLKTYIDERGREVTQVTWEVEGEETADKGNKTQSIAQLSPQKEEAFPTEDSKPAAVRSGGGEKKSATTTQNSSKNKVKPSVKENAAAKDISQGKIMSFFKKK